MRCSQGEIDPDGSDNAQTIAWNDTSEFPLSSSTEPEQERLTMARSCSCGLPTSDPDWSACPTESPTTVMSSVDALQQGPSRTTVQRTIRLA